MTLEVAYALLDFYVNKYQGGYYSPGEYDIIVDRAQNALFRSYYDIYATSQRLVDALAPFKTELQFTNVNTPGGLVSTPNNYLNLLGLFTSVVGADGIARWRPVEIVTEKNLVNRLNSQVVPVSVNDPIGVINFNWDIQLYPSLPAAGKVTYLKNPPSPVFVYTTISGRVIVYDGPASTQLLWAEQDINSILIIALSYLGINIGEQDILQFAEQKNQQNLMSKMKQ